MATMAATNPLLYRTPEQTAWVGQTETEWTDMWEELASKTGDYADCNPTNGECWQYMGSVLHRAGWVHEFRHRDRPYATSLRCLPSKVGRCFLRIEARDSYAPAV